jgi:lysozyme family protein
MAEPKWLERAKTDLTLHEIPGPQAATRIKQMFFTVGHPEITSDEVSWCAAATGTWLREAGYPTSEPIHLNLTGASYEKYGKACAPKKGAIIVSTYTRLGRKDWRRHVGIMIADPRPGAKSYKVIGGNQSDEVSVINVPISKVTATRWPVLREQSEDLPEVKVDAPREEPKPIVQPPTPPKPKDDPTPEHIYESPPMPNSKFKQCLNETLKWEGGYSNDKYDSGGATMRGVTTGRYRAFRKTKGLPPRPVKQITDAELNEIYRTYYWKPVWGDSLPPGLDLAVFDFGVNSGPSRAIKYLQRELGVRADGEMGPITLEAVGKRDVEKIIKALCTSRLAFVKRIKTYWRFGRGWTTRIHGIRRAALEMVGADDEALDVAPHPEPSADKQSAEQGRAEVETVPLNPKVAGSLGAASAGIAGAASQTPTPSIETLSAWQHAALFFQSFGNAVVNYWPYFALAALGWVLLTYGIPAAYRMYRK